MDLEQFRKHAHETVDFICDYYKNIEQYPVQSQVKPGEIASKLPQNAPEEGESFETIMKDLKEIIMPGLTHWQHPQFYAFFPANGSFPGMIGDMLSTGFGVQGMLWITSPACTELETVVLDWFANALNLPQKFHYRNGTGGGVIQGTASEAALVCLVAARHRAVKRILSDPNNKLTEDEIKAKCTVYASDQTHSSIKKACMIAGISLPNFKVISTQDTDLALTAQKFEFTIEQDRNNGLIPIFVCSTVGTTGTTAVDDLTGIGKICQRENIWMHVDAAYAGSACICEEYRPLINGIEFADSFNFNPHKWLLVNFDCSCLWVSDRNALVDSLSVVPEYLRNKATETGSVIDYRDWQIPLGRRFRSLKIWFVLRTYGLKGLKEHIRKHVAMAKEFEEWLKADTRFEITAPRNLALVCFKLKASNEKNKLLEDRLNEKGHLYLTHTVIKDNYILRMSVGGTHTKEDHVKQAWKWIQEEAEKVLHEPEPSAQK